MQKDDTGTMEFIGKAIKDTENQQLKDRLRIVKNTFLTHRQIGEAEAYYRLMPSFHLSGSNCTTLFIHTGFRNKRSVFLRSLSKEEADKMPKENVVIISNKPGQFFQKTISIEDRYDSRPDSLRNMSLSQFAKRLTKGRSSKYEDEDFLFEKESDVLFEEENEAETGITTYNEIKDDFVIAFEENKRNPLQMVYDFNGTMMKLRKPLVLRFHKFKQNTEPHEFYFSQLRLYHPHSKNDLDAWENDMDVCIKAYNEARESINYVRSKVMKYQEEVEVAQMKAQEEYESCIGDILDPTKEQEEEDCKVEGYHEPQKFIAFDVGENMTDDSSRKEGHFKKIELDSLEYLTSETRKLDEDQRLIVDIGISFAQNIRKAALRKFPSTLPKPPLIVGHGGAGCGKSFVINLMTQWQERILRESGDDPNQPYILKCAFTGTAASIINGQTLHNAFSFSFGNEYFSLSDKTRDARRRSLKNLKIVIIDEFSMVKADMLYQLDLRLKELKETPDVPFGGVAVFLFGDLLQLKPTAARYIFDEPANQQFQISHAIESLWQKFEVVNLTHNHRQGKDKEFASLLNRIRVGNATDEDFELLETRIMKQNDQGIPKDALYLSAVNADVNKINEEKLEALESTLLTIQATVKHRTVKKHKPSITNAGTIKNTPLQYLLKLKIGSRIMLTHNLDTSDGLTNGALGELVGYDISEEGKVQTLYVHFFDEKIGKQKRKLYPSLSDRFLGKRPTPISKFEFEYSESKKAYSTSASAVAYQFPIKLAWAITAHKIQGQTISKPNKLIVDLSKVFEAAQAYVMLSRVQDIEQLIIIDSVPREKIYPSSQALDELARMNKKAMNRKTFILETHLVINSLNVRSLRKHLVDIASEPQLMKSDLMLLQQTSLHRNEDAEKFSIEGFKCHLNSNGNGKGLAIYYKDIFHHGIDICTENYQMTMFQATKFDVVCVYRSQFQSKTTDIGFLKDLQRLLKNSYQAYILGDFNSEAFEKNSIMHEIEKLGFSQLLHQPTHILGGLIDHCYVAKNVEKLKVLNRNFSLKAIFG